MKSKNLTMIFVLGLLSLVVNGCEEKNLNPDCPKVGFYFMGDVVGKQMCVGDGRNNFSYDESYYPDSIFYTPNLNFSSYVVGPYGGSCYITCGELTKEQCNMKYFKDSLFSVGRKIMEYDPNKPAKRKYDFGINIIPPSVSDTLPEHYYNGYNGEAVSVFRVTELRQISDSVLIVSFLINCKLYENNIYVGNLRNAEFRGGITVRKTP